MDIEFLRTKLKTIKFNKEQLEDTRCYQTKMRSENTIDEICSNDALNTHMRRSEQMITSSIQNVAALMKEVLHHFNNGVLTTSSGSFSLTTPNDLISKTQGAWVRKEIPIWYKGKVEELWAVIPYMARVMNDYDAQLGEYWKPPTEAEADAQIPSELLTSWHSCNKALAKLLTVATCNDILTKITFTYSYGANADKHSRATPEDGLSLFFAMVTLSSPNTSEYRDQIDRQVHNCAEMVQSGNPVDFVKSVRVILQEAIRLALPVKWHVGKTIINILTNRHVLFARDLGPMANACPEIEDASGYFDKMLTDIESICVKIVENQGDSWWITTTRALDTNSTKKVKWENKSQVVCKYGMNCRNKDSGCGREHIPNGKGNYTKQGKGKGKGKGDNSKPVRCAKGGCKSNSSHYGALCKECFDTAKADGFYTNSSGKRVTVKGKQTTEAKKAKKYEANLSRAIDEGVQAKLALDTQAVPDDQLAITDGATKDGATRVYLDWDEFARLKALDKVIPQTCKSDKLSVIGNAIDMTVRGPTSHKDKVKLKYQHEDILKLTLPSILSNIQSEYGTQ
jgi:hypothetical protein